MLSWLLSERKGLPPCTHMLPWSSSPFFLPREESGSYSLFLLIISPGYSGCIHVMEVNQDRNGTRRNWLPIISNFYYTASLSTNILSPHISKQVLWNKNNKAPDLYNVFKVFFFFNSWFVYNWETKIWTPNCLCLIKA